ncbi:MAG: formate/nitrite transporter family protein, partial [Chloroflexi bacterium]|nr:formate/nitrite transporter family protein [Chloroflexota bacterium]
YPVGFLLIVLGRYQLFTENTLTPVTLVMTRIASVPALLVNWGVVLSANLLGALLVATLLAATEILSPEAAAAARSFGQHALELSFSALFFKGLIAGWLVASMVWLVHAARDSVSRFLIVYFLMFLIPALGLYHCIIGACEVIYLLYFGGTSIGQAFFGFFLPVLLGNTVGGVLLVAILNYEQTRESRFPGHSGEPPLTWQEWLFGYHTGSQNH